MTDGVRIPLHPATLSNSGRLGGSLHDIAIGFGLPEIDDLKKEIRGYWDVLLGREPCPIDDGVMTLMEISYAYYARATEVESLIHEAEREGVVLRGTGYYHFRTGELRDFIEVARKAMDLGSRMLTHETYLAKMRGDIT